MHARRFTASGRGRAAQLLRGDWLRALGYAAIGLGLACSHHGGDGEVTCSDEEPTFVVTIAAGDGALPADTVVSVHSGGSTEQYPPDGSRSMLFCTEVSDGDLDAGADVDELRCNLYTGQAAELTVQASGYPDYESTLTVERSDEDCIITGQEQVVLLPPDAGT
jgi:hypothetical protein